MAYEKIVKDEPPEGTLVRLLKDLPFGHKKGSVGQIVHDPTTWQTVIRFDYAVEGSTWFIDFSKSKDEYEVVHSTMKKKIKLIV